MKKKIIGILVCMLMISTVIAVAEAEDKQAIEQSDRAQNEYYINKNINDRATLEEWEKMLGGSLTDIGKAVRQTTDGGFIIAGSTSSYGPGDDHTPNAWLIKTNANGEEIWNKTFGGEYTDEAYSVQQTVDGGYILVGYTYSLPPDWGTEIFLIKTDSNGNEEWSKTFVKGYYQRGRSVQQTSDGGYILTGNTQLVEGEPQDGLLIKTDEYGNEEWSKTYGGPQTDHFFQVEKTFDNGYIMFGYTESFGLGWQNAWIVKVDSNGNEEWNNTFGEKNGLEGCDSGEQTNDGGYILTGYTTSYHISKTSNLLLIKTDSNGNEEWIRSFGGAFSSTGKSVKQTSDGGYIILGASHAGCWIIKTDADGVKQWDRLYKGEIDEYGGNGYYHAGSVIQSDDGSFISVGDIRGDMWMINSRMPSEQMQIDSISGGLSKLLVRAKIKNIGEVPVTNVEWTVKFVGKAWYQDILPSGWTEGTITEIAPEDKTVISTTVFGFGRVYIFVEAICSESTTVSVKQAFVFGPFIIGLREI